MSIDFTTSRIRFFFLQDPVKAAFFARLRDHPKITTDGSTQVIDKLIVTTVPYHSSSSEKSIWLDRGRSIRMQRGGQWLLLHHVPPSFGMEVSGEEREATEVLTEYQPDYFLAGHIHQFPYLGGNAPVKRIERTIDCAGPALECAPFPSHVMLDTQAGLILWQAASTQWISETFGDRFPQV